MIYPKSAPCTGRNAADWSSESYPPFARAGWPVAPADSPELAAVLHLIPGILENKRRLLNATSAAVIIRQAGQELFSAFAGSTRVGGSTPPSSGSIYRIASISKTFTSVMLFQLRDQGLLPGVNQSLTHSLPPSLTHSFTNSHSITYTLIHSLTQSLAHSFTYALTFSHTLSYSFSLAHSITHSLTHSLSHSRTRSRTHSLNAHTLSGPGHRGVVAAAGIPRTAAARRWDL